MIAQEWSELLDRQDVLIFDTETTGNGERAELLEIAVIDTTGRVRYNAPRASLGAHSSQRGGDPRLDA